MTNYFKQMEYYKLTIPPEDRKRLTYLEGSLSQRIHCLLVDGRIWGFNSNTPMSFFAAQARKGKASTESTKGAALTDTKVHSQRQSTDLHDTGGQDGGVYMVSLVSHKMWYASSHKPANLWPWVRATGMGFLWHWQVTTVDTGPLCAEAPHDPVHWELVRPATR